MSDGSSRLRIAILTHSTNPRGGVVHALALADALADLGHRPVVHAPDPAGKGFFRRSVAATRSVSASPTSSDVVAMVEARIEDYVRHFEDVANRQYDVFHAQDGISGNALATLKLFEDIGPRFEGQPGGYTQLYHLGQRQGDGAPMVVLRLME